MNNKIFEWTGVTTAILYSLFVALNIGIEFIGFSLLLLSAALIGIWAYRGKHKGILLLQFFYASAGVIGMIRWFWLKINRIQTHQFKQQTRDMTRDFWDKSNS